MRLLPLTLLALLASGIERQDDDARKAEAIFRAIEKLGKQGRHEQARIEYRALAKKYAATDWGKRAGKRADGNGIIAVDLVESNGPPANRIDYLLTSDGYLYTDADQGRWDAQAKALITAFFDEPTFKEYRPYFNTWKAFVASNESGIATKEGAKDTAFGVSSDGGTYHVIPVRMMNVFEAEPEVPSMEGLGIMIVKDNGGHPLETGWVIYGGDPSQLTHNWGHGFGTLGDEYTNKPGRTPTRLCNVSETPDPEKVPWAHWLQRKDLAKEYGISVAEGGNGMPRGQWRPSPGNCTMNDGTAHVYCAVCREATVVRIYSFVNPIDDAAADDATVVIKLKKTGDTYSIAEPKSVPWVVPLQPATHRLTTKWALKRDDAATGGGGGTGSKPKDTAPPPFDPTNKVGPEPRNLPRGRVHDRIPMEGDPVPTLPKPDKRGRVTETPDFSKFKLRPGKCTLTVEVRDETMIGRPPKPWVLKDENHNLVERRTWTIEFLE